MKYESDKENCRSDAPEVRRGIKRGGSPNIQVGSTQYHVIEERKRREKLSQHFRTLSALVPGLKKMDKASVLEDATTYLKQLQQRVKILEEISSRKPIESAVFVKKLEIVPSDSDASSTDDNSSINSSQGTLPEIEARVSDRNILIKIYCENQRGVFVKILAQIAKLNLHVVNSSVMPFGTSILDITIMAKMGHEFKVAVKDLVTSLRSSFL
ncbi:hypothetical protein ACHQM5_005963 [Ranunculus cassubicifolius]